MERQVSWPGPLAGKLMSLLMALYRKCPPFRQDRRSPGERDLCPHWGQVRSYSFLRKAHVALRDKELQVSSLVLEQAGGGVIAGKVLSHWKTFIIPSWT